MTHVLKKLGEMTADELSDDNSTNWKPLLFIIEETGSLGITRWSSPKVINLFFVPECYFELPNPSIMLIR